VEEWVEKRPLGLVCLDIELGFEDAS